MNVEIYTAAVQTVAVIGLLVRLYFLVVKGR